jgi:hypothetical protein
VPNYVKVPLLIDFYLTMEERVRAGQIHGPRADERPEGTNPDWVREHMLAMFFPLPSLLDPTGLMIQSMYPHS